MLDQAKDAIEGKRYSDALSFLKKAAQDEPRAVEVRVLLGTLYATKGAYEDAITELQFALGIEPERVDVLYQIGALRLQQGKYLDAEKKFAEVYATGFSSEELLQKMAFTYLWLSNFDKSRELYGMLIAQAPDHQESRFYFGLLSVISNRDAMLVELEKAKILMVKGDPASEMMAKDAQKYIETLNEIRSITTSWGDLNFVKRFNESNLPTLALAVVNPVLEKSPTLASALLLKARALYLLQRYEDAKPVLVSIPEADRNEAYWFYQGDLSFALEKYVDAETAYTKALSLSDGSLALVYYSKLAKVYELKKEAENAILTYEKIQQKDPQNKKAYVQSVSLYLLSLQNKDKAVEVARSAVEKFPTDPEIVNILGWALLEQGKEDEATKVLNNAIQQDSSFAPAYYNLGRIDEAHKRITEAKLNYQKALDYDTQGSIMKRADEALQRLDSQQSS